MNPLYRAWHSFHYLNNWHNAYCTCGGWRIHLNVDAWPSAEEAADEIERQWAKHYRLVREATT